MRKVSTKTYYFTGFSPSEEAQNRVRKPRRLSQEKELSRTSPRLSRESQETWLRHAWFREPVAVDKSEILVRTRVARVLQWTNLVQVNKLKYEILMRLTLRQACRRHQVTCVEMLGLGARVRPTSTWQISIYCAYESSSLHLKLRMV